MKRSDFLKTLLCVPAIAVFAKSPQQIPATTNNANRKDSVIVYGTDYVYVNDGSTGGWGTVMAIDVPGSNHVDVIL